MSYIFVMFVRSPRFEYRTMPMCADEARRASSKRVLFAIFANESAALWYAKNP